MAKSKKTTTTSTMSVEERINHAMAVHAPVLVTYQGEKDSEPRARVTFFLAEVTLGRLGAGVNVYTQCDGQHPWGFRRFAASRITAIVRVPADVDRSELAKVQAKVRTMLPSLFERE